MTRLLLLAVAVATSRAQNLVADKQGNLVASVEGRLEEPGITILRLTITALLPNHGLLGDLLKLLEYMWRCSFIHLFIAMPVYMRPMRHRNERHTPQLPLIYHLLLAYIKHSSLPPPPITLPWPPQDGKQVIIKQGSATVDIVAEVKQARRDAVDNAASIAAEARTARKEATTNAECSDAIVRIGTHSYSYPGTRTASTRIDTHSASYRHALVLTPGLVQHRIDTHSYTGIRTASCYTVYRVAQTLDTIKHSAYRNFL